MFDGEEFGRDIVQAVKDYVERATKPLERRIAELEARLMSMESRRTGMTNPVHLMMELLPAEAARHDRPRGPFGPLGVDWRPKGPPWSTRCCR